MVATSATSFPAQMMPAMPTTATPNTASNLTTPVGTASPELTVKGPTAWVFADLLSVVINGGGVPVVVAGMISVFASCVVVCVPVALGSGGVTVCGGANSVFAVRAVVKAVGA